MGKARRQNCPEVRPITLGDVARRAGVSEITVSRVLRGVGPLAEATRALRLNMVHTISFAPERSQLLSTLVIQLVFVTAIARRSP